jgi:hypothetical protein
VGSVRGLVVGRDRFSVAGRGHSKGVGRAPSGVVFAIDVPRAKLLGYFVLGAAIAL